MTWNTPPSDAIGDFTNIWKDGKSSAPMGDRITTTWMEERAIELRRRERNRRYRVIWPATLLRVLHFPLH
jgi:hypothetical protein